MPRCQSRRRGPVQFTTNFDGGERKYMSVHAPLCRRGQNLLTKTCDVRPGPLLLTMILSVLSAVPAAATTESTLYSFHWFPPPGQANVGGYPAGPLLRDANGALYGAATLGGASFNGTIY